MKIVLDCNVFISSGINNGIARFVFEYIIINCEVYASADILAEYIEVINRKKFQKWKPYLDQQLKLFIKAATIIKPQNINLKLPDKEDVIYLSLALDIKAKYLITGNIRHFPDVKYGSTQVITPREFFDQYIAQ